MTDMQRFHFHAGEEPEDRGTRPRLRGIRGVAPDADVSADFHSDEAAARFHLDRLLGGDERPGLRGITAPERPGRMPDLRMTSTQDLPQTGTHLVSFEQTQDDIPVFGGKAVCEMDADRTLVSASGKLGRPTGVSKVASVSQQQALAAIAAEAGVEPETLREVAPGRLNYFQDDGGAWHLAFLFERVPAAPPALLEESRGHGLGRSPRSLRPLVDYLVDAHTAEVIVYFSRTPLMAPPPPLPVPTKGSGVGEGGETVEFWGRMVGDDFELADPLRDIKTYDLGLGDIVGATLADPFRSGAAHLGDGCRGLVSAHRNATIVYDFIKGVLLRDGIDAQGMDLVNVVNCTYSEDEQPPTWHNAVWYEDRMWYGQVPGGDGALVSFSRHLDVIAHELAHGLTQYTADLVYLGQSGALNESFSDIFGIIIKNWEAPDGGDVGAWEWQLGLGLGQGGGPLRDLADPAATGDPGNMRDYVETTADSGGVHINSNIHNKAAYHVLTARRDDGGYAFTPREVSYLYYLGLTRLARTDGFDDALQALIDVAMTYYRGDTAERDAKVGAIREAYAKVGIGR